MKGIVKTIPNQEMLINAIVLQEAKDSSENENIITTQDGIVESQKVVREILYINRELIEILKQ